MRFRVSAGLACRYPCKPWCGTKDTSNRCLLAIASASTLLPLASARERERGGICAHACMQPQHQVAWRDCASCFALVDPSRGWVSIYDTTAAKKTACARRAAKHKQHCTPQGAATVKCCCWPCAATLHSACLLTDAWTLVQKDMQQQQHARILGPCNQGAPPLAKTSC